MKSARVSKIEREINPSFCVVGLIITFKCQHIFSIFGGIQIETRNNKLEMQSVNNKALIEELDKVIERLRVPSEVCFTLCLLLICLLGSLIKLLLITVCSIPNRRLI